MCQRNIGDAMNLVNGQKCLHFVTDVAVDNILLQINARQKIVVQCIATNYRDLVIYSQLFI
jgi:hypothetical protein